MKAIVQQHYGTPSHVLRLAEVGLPEVADEDVLVRVRASSANPWAGTSSVANRCCFARLVWAGFVGRSS